MPQKEQKAHFDRCTRRNHFNENRAESLAEECAEENRAQALPTHASSGRPTKKRKLKNGVPQNQILQSNKLPKPTGPPRLVSLPDAKESSNRSTTNDVATSSSSGENQLRKRRVPKQPHPWAAYWMEIKKSWQDCHDRHFYHPTSVQRNPQQQQHRNQRQQSGSGAYTGTSLVQLMMENTSNANAAHSTQLDRYDLNRLEI